MAYGLDQRVELLERDLCELATILAERVQDRPTVERLSVISARHARPAPVSGDDEDEPPLDDLSTPARPA